MFHELKKTNFSFKMFNLKTKWKLLGGDCWCSHLLIRDQRPKRWLIWGASNPNSIFSWSDPVCLFQVMFRKQCVLSINRVIAIIETTHEWWSERIQRLLCSLEGTIPSVWNNKKIIIIEFQKKIKKKKKNYFLQFRFLKKRKKKHFQVTNQPVAPFSQTLSSFCDVEHNYIQHPKGCCEI